MEFPKTPREMIRFLGALNFYSEFIPRFSEIASILYKMSQSTTKFRRSSSSEEAIKAFEKLKNSLASAPVLAYPDFTQPFIIHTDASGIAVGAVIGQIIQQRFRPIMFASRHLSTTETRYSGIERELLAIVWAAKKFNSYIYGRHSTFVTDHKPLVTMKTLKDPLSRVGRLFFKMKDLDYHLVYQPGASNYTADMLSRIETSANSVQIQFKSTVNWAIEQINDKTMSKIIELVNETCDTSEWSSFSEASLWSKVRDSLFVYNNVLYKDHFIAVPSHLHTTMQC